MFASACALIVRLPAFLSSSSSLLSQHSHVISFLSFSILHILCNRSSHVNKYWSVSVPGTFECKIQTNYITCHDYIVYTLYPRDLFWVVVYNCVKHEVATVESEHPEEGVYTLPITITVKYMTVFNLDYHKKVCIIKNELIHLKVSFTSQCCCGELCSGLRLLQHRVAISQFCLLMLHEMPLTSVTSSGWCGLALLSSRCRIQLI